MKLFFGNTRLPLFRKIASYFPLLTFVVIAVAFAVTSFQSFRKIEGLIVEDKLQDLGAIADMKAGQITTWKKNLIRHGETFPKASFVPDEFDRWQRQGMPPDARKKILKALLGMKYVHGYKDITLFDPQGLARISTMEGNAVRDADDVALAAEAIRSGKVIMSDIHRGGPDGEGIRIDLVAPLVVAEGKGDSIVGAVVFEIDPREFLYPLVESWPSPSPSSETVLIRLDGDSVMYLNDLRYRKGTALSLRLPLSMSHLPAVMAVRGVESTTEGVDYRGVNVAAAMRAVPGTSWFMVSKIDRDEFLEPAIRLKQWSMTLGLALALIGGMLVLFWLKANQARYKHLKSQHDAAVEREMLVRHFELLTKYANDIILVADNETRIIDANERALETFGYTLDELLNMRIADFRDPAQELSEFNNRLTELVAKGELRVEDMVRRKDGSIFPVEISARVIEVQGKRYIQGILRDITERRRVEDALRKSETMLRKSQQMAQIGSWELDLVNNVLTWSDENYRIFEIDRALFGASYEAFLNAVHPDDRAMVNKAYTDSVTNKAPYRIVHRLLFPPQRVKYVREWCETFYDPDGNPLRSIGTTQDITEHNKAEQEYQAILQATTDGFLVVDAHEGRFLDANLAYSRMTDYSVEELLTMRIADVEALESPERIRQHMQALRESGNALFETCHRCKDGRVIDIEVSTCYLDIRGGVLITFVRDISGRKQAEKKLFESEARFRAMADNAPIIIWMANAGGVQAYIGCGFFNKRWHDFTGLTAEESQNYNWISIVHPDDRGRCLDVYIKAFETIQEFKLEYRLQRHDGVYRWMQDSGVPRFSPEGKFIGFIGTCVDISDRKLFEELRAEMEHSGRLNIAGEMASGMAHELSQPLTACSNYLDGCLRRMDENDWDREKLHMAVMLAHKQAERAGKIISHLKDLVRKRGHERAPTDINLLARDTMSFLEDEIKRQGISLTMTLFPLPQVMACRVEIEQVLFNLYKNAIESMYSCPQRELCVSTRTTESGDVLVTVSDTGRGVLPAEMENLFNPFQTSKKDGLGLGLAICRTFVENHGGRIWANPQRELGAEFNFILPVGDADE